MNEAINFLKVDALNDDLKRIAEIIGVENFKKVIVEFGGNMLYIPKLDSMAIEHRNEQIKKEYNGYNSRELALKHNVSERWVRSIVEEETKEIRLKPMDGQVSFFE